jgi:hypothetical protein
MAQIKVLKIDSDGINREHDSTADDVTFLSGNFGNVQVSANAIISTDTNGDLALTPDGTGDLVLDGVNWPQADGSTGQILQTNGSGQLSWVDIPEFFNSYTADEALADRDFVYVSAADNVSKCDASGGGAASQGIGFVTSSAADTDPVNVQSEGVLNGFTSLTAGARYYADPATPGLITSTLPTGTGQTIVQVGYAKSTTEMHIHIEQLGRRA